MHGGLGHVKSQCLFKAVNEVPYIFDERKPASDVVVEVKGTR